MKHDSNAAADADRWNSAVPEGSAVLVTLDDGTTKTTKTRSQAWTLGASCHGPGHTAVVLLEGVSGGYMLSRCTPIVATAQSVGDQS